MTIKFIGFVVSALFCLAACSAANDASGETAYVGDDADEDFDASFLEGLPPDERAEIEAMLREDGMPPPQQGADGPAPYQEGVQPAAYSGGGQANMGAPRSATPNNAPKVQ